MADFSALKTAIQNYIKQNGNEEITGEILQTILLSIVNTLGDSAIDDLITALNNEVANRQNADGSLEGAINQEGVLRSNADSTLQGNINAEAIARENADAALQAAIDLINSYIPAQTSSSNQLADKAFVNSSIATATATFRGSYNVVTDLELSYNATHAQIQAALATKMTELSITADKNDYAFVQIPTADATPTQIAKTEKYKYNGSAWAFEYVLNNSGFTAAQWAAINSGATLELIGKLSALPTNAELTALLAAKQDVIQDLATIRSGASAGATAVQPATLNAALSNTVIESGVFDLSSYNNGTTYADLNAALTALNALPAAYKKGGMSLKYVQTSDNKYVQYRLMSDTFNTTEANWQGVDDEPTLESDNLVKSGGVYKAIKSRKEITQFTRFAIQKESQKLSFSDNTFGNITTQFAVSVIFKHEPVIYNNTDVVIVGKGDYTTNGWAVVRKPNNQKIYFVANNISYPLITTGANSSLNYNVTLISKEQYIDAYVFSKKVLSLSKDGLTDNNSPLQIGGGYIGNYSYVYCLFAALWYKDISIEECINDVSKVYKGKFSRNDLAADFVCCDTSLIDNGFVDGEHSLLCENAMSITYVDIQVSKGININNGFDVFGIHTAAHYSDNFSLNESLFTTSLLDVSNYCKVNIDRLAWYQYASGLVCIFYNDKKSVISSINSDALTRDGLIGFCCYKNQWSVDIPVDAKYVQVCLCVDGHVTFDKRDAEYITPSVIDVPKYTDKSFNKVPCIMFEASDYLSAYWITRKGWWEDKDGIEVLASDSENKTISISTDYLSYFYNNVVYNMVYETPNEEQDIMYLFRNTDDGTMHILSDVVPPIGTMLYTHIQVNASGESSGEMHLSTLAYKVLGHKIFEDSHNIYNAQLTNRCGSYFNNQFLSVTGTTKDVNNNDCFYFNGQTFAPTSSMQGRETWGVREHAPWFELNNNRNAYFKHKAPFRKGYYDIKAVAPRFYRLSSSQVENYPVTINVYNDEHLIHTQTVCDYRYERIIVGIDRECSGNQILNLNKEVEDKAYTNTTMIISAIPQDKRKLGMIVTARISNSDGVFNSKWTTLMFIGDTLEKFTETRAWIDYTFGCVKIEFVNENSNNAVIAIKRIMQYDFNENYFDMGINAPTLIQSNVGKNPSYVAVLGDSWTEAADDNTVRFEDAITLYEEDGASTVSTHYPRPLLRGIKEKGCNLDSWGLGTKTAMWGWIHQIRPLVQHTEYTHCIVEFFTNDTYTDWYSAMPALVKILQENGIIPIVFAPISGREAQTGYLKAVL